MLKTSKMFFARWPWKIWISLQVKNVRRGEIYPTNEWNDLYIKKLGNFKEQFMKGMLLKAVFFGVYVCPRMFWLSELAWIG